MRYTTRCLQEAGRIVNVLGMDQITKYMYASRLIQQSLSLYTLSSSYTFGLIEAINMNEFLHVALTYIFSIINSSIINESQVVIILSCTFDFMSFN